MTGEKAAHPGRHAAADSAQLSVESMTLLDEKNSGGDTQNFSAQATDDYYKRNMVGKDTNRGPAKYATVLEGYRLPKEDVLLAELLELKEGAAAASTGRPKQHDRDARRICSSSKVLSLARIPRPLVEMEYAVRGAIVTRADEIKKELQTHPEKLRNFSELICANIGNPHAVGQKPITFHRQVISCLINPDLLHHSASSGMTLTMGENHPALFPLDVATRAGRYLQAFPSFGAYSPSAGVSLFREIAAAWFSERDGFPCDASSVFLTDGASPAIKTCLEMLISSPSDGILIPVPQYPLYTATITRLNGRAVPYYLSEEHGWALHPTELERALREARAQCDKTVKALAVINPANPTGALLNEQLMIDIVRFCERERLVLLADEVYQNNVYGKKPFVSFRKVLKTLQSPVELVSFHSSSKSVGECGVRGGVMQIENWNADAVAVLNKLVSVTLCSNTLGQAMMTSVMDSIRPGDASYASWKEETDALHMSLARKAHLAYEAFNSMPGMSCQPIEGAMYAFPRLDLPPAAIKTANQRKVQPDMLWCMELLEATGIVCVPGSGFQQKPGTAHFRVTILPVEDKYIKMLQDIRTFHAAFLRRYSDGAAN